MKTNIKITIILFLAPAWLGAESKFQTIQRANRKTNAKVMRATIANNQSRRLLLPQPTNGDEFRYQDKRGSYGKGLVQDANGLINVNAYNKLVVAMQSETQRAFDNIPMGTNPVQRRLHSPQAALSLDMVGGDSWIYSIPVPPALASAERAGEEVELYWMAIMRDVNFTDFSVNLDAAAAIADLNNLSDFKGPKENGLVTPQTLFRANDIAGVLIGPYISQFFYKNIPFSDTVFDQRYTVPLATNANDFMTTVAEWSFIQPGNNPIRTITFDPTPRYIHTLRNIGNYVHKDPPQWPYLCVLQILLSFGQTAWDQNNPYIGNPTQEPFVDFLVPQYMSMISQVTELALRAAWYEKWAIQRILRPEFYGFLVNQQITGTFDADINQEVINSDAVQRIFALNAVINGGQGTYLLPQAYPEGSPLHPSYPAGHASVAGACITLLKAFFNESFVIPNPVVPNSTGTALVPIPDALTVGNELNKFGANMAFARNMAGVHYRSDATESLYLGEQVALAFLEDWAYNNHIDFAGFTLTKFDGTQVIVGAKRIAPTV